MGKPVELDVCFYNCTRGRFRVQVLIRYSMLRPLIRKAVEQLELLEEPRS
jgi:hypothetical protein